VSGTTPVRELWLLASALGEACHIFIVNRLQAESQVQLILALIMQGNL
jgi:hypothetical protein